MKIMIFGLISALSTIPVQKWREGGDSIKNKHLPSCKNHVYTLGHNWRIILLLSYYPILYLYTQTEEVYVQTYVFIFIVIPSLLQAQLLFNQGVTHRILASRTTYRLPVYLSCFRINLDVLYGFVTYNLIGKPFLIVA